MILNIDELKRIKREAFKEGYDKGHKIGFEERALHNSERPQGDLISREALKNAFKAWKTMDDYYHDTDCNDIPLSEAFDLINNAPTVERPIRGIAKMDKNGNIEIELLKPQGKWIEFKGGYYKCDNCGEVERAKKNFCSNCGVKMLNG